MKSCKINDFICVFGVFTPKKNDVFDSKNINYEELGLINNKYGFLEEKIKKKESGRCP